MIDDPSFSCEIMSRLRETHRDDDRVVSFIIVNRLRDGQTVGTYRFVQETVGQIVPDFSVRD